MINYQANAMESRERVPDSGNDDHSSCLCGKTISKEFVPRLGKRLTYLLRYGALKEGLSVYHGGFVKLSELLTADLLKWDTEEEVINEINGSTTVQGDKRFDVKFENEQCLVRAAHGRKLEPPINHCDSSVSKLLELCFDYVVKNIKKYDMEDFPDEFLMSRLFFRLKYEKRLNNSTLSSLLGHAMDSLNFNRVFITESTLKLVTIRCPNLSCLELKSCGYVVNNKIIEMLCKNLHNLRKLNVCDCPSLTDVALTYPLKYHLKLEFLNICHVPKISFTALKTFIAGSPYLQTLLVQGNSNIGPMEVKKLKAESISQPPTEIFSDCDKTCHCIKTTKYKAKMCSKK